MRSLDQVSVTFEAKTTVQLSDGRKGGARDQTGEVRRDELS